MPVVLDQTTTTVPTDPAALIAAGACYKCIPKGLEMPVLIYLLNTVAGSNLTVEQLIEAAKCYKCIPTGMQQEVVIYLLDAILAAQ